MENTTQLAELAVASLFRETSTPVLKDLKINLERLLTQTSLDLKTGALLLISLGTHIPNSTLAAQLQPHLESLGISPVESREAREVAGLMGMLNAYYRTRHFLTTNLPDLKDSLGGAGLRMTSMAKPALGTLNFEILCFAHSVVNGCEMCITSHAEALQKAGASLALIHDLMRLSATLAGIGKLPQ